MIHLAKLLVVEPEVERLDKLERYYNHFEIGKRYGLTFREFERKVNNNTWDAYLAE